jgi:hypothetical protein
MSRLTQWLHRGNLDEPLPSPIPVTEVPEIPDHPARPSEPLVTGAEISAGQVAIRAALEESGYSSFVSDMQCETLATRVLLAAAKVRLPG